MPDIGPSERKAYAKKVERSLKKAEKLDDAALRKVRTVLRSFGRSLKTEIATRSVDGFQTQYQENILAGVDLQVGNLTSRLAGTLQDIQSESWDEGVAAADEQMEAIAIETPAYLPSVRALTMMQNHSADLITNLGSEARNRISTQIRSNILGEKSLTQTMKDIDGVLATKPRKGITARAENIARTEVGRIRNVATKARINQAAERDPDIMKTWKATSPIRSRPSHWALNNVTIPYDEKFDVGGYSADYPMDPALPPEESCRCMCRLVISHKKIVEKEK